MKKLATIVLLMAGWGVAAGQTAATAQTKCSDTPCKHQTEATCGKKDQCCKQEGQCGKKEAQCCKQEGQCGKKEGQCCKHEGQCGKKDAQCGKHEGQCGKHEGQCGKHEGQCGKHDGPQCGKHEGPQCGKKEAQCGKHEGQCGKHEAQCGKQSPCHAAGRAPQMPAFLKPGDKIAVLSPASTPKPEVVEKGVKVLRDWGYQPVVGKHVLDNVHGYAGTIDDRLDDFVEALKDPEVKAIFCTRGGYGSAMLLERIDQRLLADNPKWVVGYSDITSLHSAEVRSGNMSIHGNMLGALSDNGGKTAIDGYLRGLLAGDLPAYEVPAHPYNHPGTATGIVLGGNLSVMQTNVSGSAQWDFLDRDYIAGRDIILFFEDVSENLNRVGSLLTQLRLKGVLNQVKGILVGRFTEYEPANGYADMNAMIHDRIGDLDIPVCYDFPASHDEKWNYPLVEGCPATLTVTSGGVTLKFHK